MANDQAVQVAIQLRMLGVSDAGVINLLSYYPLDEIERQLAYLPYRKAKRPSAFIVEAVRNKYSPPNEYVHAQASNKHIQNRSALDQNS